MLKQKQQELKFVTAKDLETINKLKEAIRYLKKFPEYHKFIPVYQLHINKLEGELSLSELHTHLHKKHYSA